MRRLRLQAQETRIWKRWVRDCEKETAEVSAAMERGEYVEFKPKLYGRKSLRRDYFSTDGAPFHGKCAYCEAPIKDFTHANIDHFRPKAQVRDAEGRTVYLLDEDGRPRRDESGNRVKHPGYYWLAYDWRNLLPTCDKCNQPNRIGDQLIGKHDRFPVEGRHAQTPEEIAEERPLLLDPSSDSEQDDPAEHLEVDPETGHLKPKNGSRRGKTCIEVFGLNSRAQLVEARHDACRAVFEILTRIARNEASEKDWRDLAEIRAGRRPYSLAQQAILEGFRDRVMPILEG